MGFKGCSSWAVSHFILKRKNENKKVTKRNRTKQNENVFEEKKKAKT